MSRSTDTLWNTEKLGTIILGHYRSGTHFLHDVITSSHGSRAHAMGEIDSINQIKNIVKSDQYSIAIFNGINPKFELLSKQGREITKNWHLVRLTRKNKISHFISHYFWSLNTLEERLTHQAIFKHHNSDHSVYKNFLKKQPVVFPVDQVRVWLQEQMIIDYLPYDSALDYDDLSKYDQIIEWRPNQYQDISLDDLFVNHNEIYDLLSSFSFKVYP